MASVTEVWQKMGVVHTDDCSVCEVEQGRSSWHVPDMLGNIVAGLIGIAILIGIAVTVYTIGFYLAKGISVEPPLEQIHRGYNHIKIYEDGSYEGETSEGQYERGCILVAECND